MACGFFVALPSCTVGPDFKSPRTEISDEWVSRLDPGGGPTTVPTTRASEALASGPPVVRWWTTFNDPVLDSLVIRAMRSNLDLKLATARLREARAQRGVSWAGFFPEVDATGSYRRSKSGGSNTSIGTVVNPGGGGTDSGGTDGTGGTGGTSSGTTTVIRNNARNLYTVGFDATWELDFFGGIRRDIEASDADIIAAVEDRRDVFVTLLSEVARNYVELRGFQRQLMIAQENLDAQQHSADVTRKRAVGGFQRGLDVTNADALVASTRSQIPTIESNAQQSIYAISVLLGQAPGALLDELSTVSSIPRTPPQVPIGIPSELLRRRPDVRRAEAQLHAATARIGVAVADLFPRFSLTGSFGREGASVKPLGNSSGNFWSYGPAVSWPIIDFGRIRSNIDVQDAREEQAFVTYQSAVLTALRDVETSLVAYTKEQQHRQALEEAVILNRKAVATSNELYLNGGTTFLEVLTAERALFSSEDALVQSDQTIATNLVALYKSLGGGWEISDPLVGESTGKLTPETTGIR